MRSPANKPGPEAQRLYAKIGTFSRSKVEGATAAMVPVRESAERFFHFWPDDTGDPPP